MTALDSSGPHLQAVAVTPAPQPHYPRMLFTGMHCMRCAPLMLNACCRSDPLLEVAMQLEQAALQDEYFKQRHLCMPCLPLCSLRMACSALSDTCVCSQTQTWTSTQARLQPLVQLCSQGRVE